MEITENIFIDILGLPEWDDKVLEVLEALELERPIVEEGEVYAYLSSDKYGIDIMFNYDCITPLQKELEANRNLYVSQVSFKENTSLSLLFGIKKGDNYQEIVTKLNKDTDTEEEYIDDTCEWELSNNDTPYSLYCIFEDKNLKNLKNIWLRVQLPLSELV